MSNTVATLLLVLAAAQGATHRVLESPRFTLTAEEQAGLVEVLRARPADKWRTVERPEAQRSRFDALHRAVEALRRPPGREPLALVGSWWRVLARGRTYPSQAATAGRLVSRPFSGYHVQVPRSYRADRPTPLVICLHRTGSRGGRSCLADRWKDPALREQAIVFAPDWPHGEGTPRWSHRRYLHLTFGILGDVILNDFNIDRNRIFLDGGTEAWRLSATFAHLFAGVIIRGDAPPELASAGGGLRDDPFPFANLKNVDVLFLRGGDEEGLRSLSELATGLRENTRRYRIVGLPGATPGEPGRARAVTAFVQRTRRNPYPRFVDWTVAGRHAARAYWVRSLDEAEPALEGDATLPRFQVVRDRAANRIEIDAHRIRGFEISLNDAILDLSRPVTITVNGARVFHGQPVRSLARALRSVARSGDWTDIYPWVTRVEIPSRP